MRANTPDGLASWSQKLRSVWLYEAKRSGEFGFMKPVEPASWGWLNWLHGDWSRLNRLHEASLTGFMGFEAGCRPSYDCKGFLGFPITPKICIYCFLMIYAFTGINFDIQHAYIPSQLAKWHFRGPYRPLRALVKGLRVKKNILLQICCVYTQSIQACKKLATFVENCGQDSQKN